MDILYIILGFAGNLFGWWHDYSYSARFIFYRASEGNSWFTDKYGFMSKTKPFIGLAIEQGFAIGAGLLAWGLGYPESAAISYGATALGAGIAHYLQAKIKLTKRLKSDRLKQIIARNQLQQLVDPEDRPASVDRLMWSGLRAVKHNDGRYWHPSVQFLWVDANDLEEARPILGNLLFDWLRLPDPTEEDTVEERRDKLELIWHDLKFHPDYEKTTSA